MNSQANIVSEETILNPKRYASKPMLPNNEWFNYYAGFSDAFVSNIIVDTRDRWLQNGCYREDAKKCWKALG